MAHPAPVSQIGCDAPFSQPQGVVAVSDHLLRARRVKYAGAHREVQVLRQSGKGALPSDSRIGRLIDDRIQPPLCQQGIRVQVLVQIGLKGEAGAVCPHSGQRAFQLLGRDNLRQTAVVISVPLVLVIKRHLVLP